LRRVRRGQPDLIILFSSVRIGPYFYIHR
jgi:hypothetical protein